MDWRLRLPGAMYRRASDRAGGERSLAALVLAWLTTYVQHGTPIVEVPLTGEEIQRIRRSLEENVETFGARFGRSGRTVEQWEQDRQVPDGLIRAQIQQLDAQTGATT